MEYVIRVPERDPTNGLQFEWDNGFEIEVNVSDSEISIRANEAGLISLSRHLLTLAQPSTDTGSPIHLTADMEIESPVDVTFEKINK